MAFSGIANLTVTKYSEDKLTTKEKSKIRKPMVEKMRRDRINLCINKLQKLLEQDFHVLQPDSKPEKADILELAVQFLKKQICHFSIDNKAERSNHPEFNFGYSNCLHEAQSFLSTHCFQEQTQVHFLNYIQHLGSHQHSIPTRTMAFSQHQKNSDLLFTGSETFWRPW
uniref:Transcription factor HES-5 n=1 Tax=Leptobrachium leishanense TaxID=445787 RepID=A0A8C5PD76_9ANUR